MAAQVLDALGKWIGALPARLSLVTVVGAAVFGAISGSSMATTATLSATLAPEMKARGYSPEMIAGPIIGAGGLAMIIPPSAMAVLLGTIAHISIGHLLIGGIVPGLLIATGYLLVILLRVWWNPKLVPQEVYVPPDAARKAADAEPADPGRIPALHGLGTHVPWCCDPVGVGSSRGPGRIRRGGRLRKARLGIGQSLRNGDHQDHRGDISPSLPAPLRSARSSPLPAPREGWWT